MLKGKNILVGITGSIAAFKMPALVRLLKKEGANVKVVMTPCSTDFVTPLTLSTVSQQPVLLEPYNKTDGSWHSHVDWGRWADLFLIAPASANTLAKMAGGIADNLLTTCYLAAKCPVFFAPAMDLDMFYHPTTAKNIKTLISYGNRLIEPQTGELASGLTGAGRMEEPDIILSIIKDFFSKSQDLSGKKVLITAGPTFEAIDPVRYIGNHSSGRMGYALADEAASRGASVTLISGPVNIKATNQRVTTVSVMSADDMYNACMKSFDESDICIMAAAVADFTPEIKSSEKIKKSENLELKLKRTQDILAVMGQGKRDSQYLVGFALETENEISNARIKLNNKNLNAIVLNSLKDEGAGFGVDTNKVTMLFKDQTEIQTETLPKTEIAGIIIDEIVKRFQRNN